MVIADTNVISELMRFEPVPSVLAWMSSADAVVVTTAVTMAEVEFGIERMPAGRQKDQLRISAGATFGAFGSRVLPFDAAAARTYGVSMAERRRSGRPIAVLDAQIAAICRSRGAALATRNVRDFDDLGIELVNPWEFDG